MSTKLDGILQTLIQALEWIAPMTSNDLDDRALEFLKWLLGDAKAKQVLAACPCVDCNPKDMQDFPSDCEAQVQRWVATQGPSTPVVASRDWVKLISQIIEIWKMISVLLQDEKPDKETASPAPESQEEKEEEGK